ncbi:MULTISPECIES: hypothetical protein [Sorangium]|nr:hypothetical protein [Sorangium cellulosum]
MQHVLAIVRPHANPPEQPAKEGNAHLVHHSEAEMFGAEVII